MTKNYYTPSVENTAEDKIFKLYTVKEAMVILGKSKSSIHKLINDGDIAVVRIHNLIRITPEAIYGYLSSKCGYIPADIPKFCEARQKAAAKYPQNFFTIKEVCEILQTCEGFTRKLINSNELKAIRIQSSIRVPADALLKFIADNEHRSLPQ